MKSINLVDANKLIIRYIFNQSLLTTCHWYKNKLQNDSQKAESETDSRLLFVSQKALR
jgi:hypothetical protein